MSLLGFAQRAGKLVSGDAGVRSMLRNKRAYLIVLAGDASPSTKDIFRGLSARAGVELVEYSTKDELGQAIGKSHRSVLAVVETDFARTISGLMKGEQGM